MVWASTASIAIGSFAAIGSLRHAVNFGSAVQHA